MIGLYLILVRKAISTEKRDINTDMSYERSARMESSGKETFVIAAYIMKQGGCWSHASHTQGEVWYFRTLF